MQGFALGIVVEILLRRCSPRKIEAESPGRRQRQIIHYQSISCSRKNTANGS